MTTDDGFESSDREKERFHIITDYNMNKLVEAQEKAMPAAPL